MEKEYHVSDMKQFLFDPLRVDPLDVARHDYMEFFVETVAVWGLVPHPYL